MKCHHIVSSRNFEAEIFGQNYTILVPIFDLFMHEPARNNGTKYMYNKDNRAFELYSTKEYKEGEQVFYFNTRFLSIMEIIRIHTF